MHKYSIRIELNQDGSTTHLGDFRISARLANELSEIQCDKPNVLKGIFAITIEKLGYIFFGKD